MQTLSIYTPQWDEHDSYGILAGRLARRAEQCFVHVNRIGMQDGGGEVRPVTGGLLLGYPTLHREFGALANMGKRLAITMFESTKLPEGWSAALNRCDGVVVPAQFLVQVFRDAGVTVPVHVVPLGVSEAYGAITRKIRPEKKPFVFLAIADRGMRKGWDLAWHAFRSAFGNSANHKLILKCREGAMLNVSSADANVEILRADLDEREMAELYAQCDCMVFPTRGEGFGLPPREFAATGGHVIATRWGGTADDIDLWGYGIPAKMVPAWMGHERFEALGEWAEPDLDQLVHLMRVVAREACYSDGARARALQWWTAHHYCWNRFADRVFEIYRGL
jgi:hypothetical protein